MWCLGTWFSGALGSAGLTVELEDPKGLFQPKRFYDSVILHISTKDDLTLKAGSTRRGTCDFISEMPC